MAPKTRSGLVELASESETDKRPLENTIIAKGLSSQGPGEAQGSSTAGTLRWPNKAASMTQTTGKLSFTVKQSADHARLFDSQVVKLVDEGGSNRDSSYSLEYPDVETTDNAPTGQCVTPPPRVDHSQIRPNLAPNKISPFTSSFLFGEGYVPVSDFQPNAAFSSIHGSASGSKYPSRPEESWRRRSPDKVAMDMPLPPSPRLPHPTLTSANELPEIHKGKIDSQPPSTVEGILDEYVPSGSAASVQNSSADDAVPPAKSMEENRIAVHVMLQKFLRDEERVNGSMKEQLSMLSTNQRIMVQEMAHI